MSKTNDNCSIDHMKRPGLIGWEGCPKCGVGRCTTSVQRDDISRIATRFS